MKTSTTLLTLASIALLTTACADDLEYGYEDEIVEGDGTVGDGDGDDDEDEHEDDRELGEYDDGDGDDDDDDGDKDVDDQREGDDDDGDDEACEEVEANIIAGQQFEAGNVTMYTVGDNLIVEVEGDNGWQFAAAHLYVGLEQLENDAPGSFPFATEFEGLVDGHVFEIDMSAMEFGCGDEVTVAVHVEAELPANGCENQAETGWAEGENGNEHGWGWNFTLDICCDSETPV